MPPRGRPDDSGYKKLKKDLAEGTPGKLYILHGEETYLRDHYLGRLKELILSGGMGEFNFHELEGKDMSPHALEEAVDCLPMMAERTLVQVTDFDLFKAGEKEVYIRILSNLPDYCGLVFLYDVLEGLWRPDAADLLRPAGPAAGAGRPLRGPPVGDAVPGQPADEQRPAVFPVLVPPGGDPLRPDPRGHAFGQRPDPGGADDHPAAGADQHGVGRWTALIEALMTAFETAEKGGKDPCCAFGRPSWWRAGTTKTPCPRWQTR